MEPRRYATERRLWTRRRFAGTSTFPFDLPIPRLERDSWGAPACLMRQGFCPRIRRSNDQDVLFHPLFKDHHCS